MSPVDGFLKAVPATGTERKTIGIPLYPNFDSLDVLGPFQTFTMAADRLEPKLLAASKAPVQSFEGVSPGFSIRSAMLQRPDETLRGLQYKRLAILVANAAKASPVIRWKCIHVAGKVWRVPSCSPIPSAGMANAPRICVSYSVASLAAGWSSCCHTMGG
jgi:hypothetical protein